MGLYETLRAKYPNPVRTPQDQALSDPETYCVGGALAREMGLVSIFIPGGIGVSGTPAEPGRSVAVAQNFEGMIEWRAPENAIPVGTFPDTAVLTMALQQANPSLPTEVALAYAKRITVKNDTGNFETAWQTLADALAWSEADWTPADDAAVLAFIEEVSAT